MIHLRVSVSLQLQAAPPCAFHYKVFCVFQHSGSGSLDVGAPLQTGGARRTAKISIRLHVKEKALFQQPAWILR